MNLLSLTTTTTTTTTPLVVISNSPHKRRRLSLKYICQTPLPLQSDLTTYTNTNTNTVSDKLKRLVLEFGSLPEPIDRVKKLLHHATTLPHFTDTTIRSESNRVRGCTTQVWLEARLDRLGTGTGNGNGNGNGSRMRFRADSDSEITKGFVSCLVWLLDGAQPCEVLMIQPDDLRGMNVGLHANHKSRVNTWHNVLYAMKSKTKSLIEEEEEEEEDNDNDNDNHHLTTTPLDSPLILRIDTTLQILGTSMYVG